MKKKTKKEIKYKSVKLYLLYFFLCISMCICTACMYIICVVSLSCLLKTHLFSEFFYFLSLKIISFFNKKKWCYFEKADRLSASDRYSSFGRLFSVYIFTSDPLSVYEYSHALSLIIMLHGIFVMKMCV